MAKHPRSPCRLSLLAEPIELGDRCVVAEQDGRNVLCVLLAEEALGKQVIQILRRV